MAKSQVQTPKVSFNNLVDSLFKESTQQFQETAQGKWEWDHYIRLRTLSQEISEREIIRDQQDGPPGNGAEDDAARRLAELPAFTNWLKRNNVKFDKLNLMPDTNGDLRVFVSAPLKEGETVFSVPTDMIINTELARTSKLSVLVTRDPLLYNMQNVLIAMFLIYEKYVNMDSFWEPYIRILPTTFDTPAFYSEADMELLKKVSLRAFYDCLKSFKHICRQYAYFHVKFKKTPNFASKALKKVFTFKRYAWAVAAVSTRVNNWPSEDGKTCLCLIPLLDMCNHIENVGFTTEYEAKTEQVICSAGQDFDEGTEFRMFYGHRSSADFLVHNGFVPNNWRHDAFVLDMNLGPKAENYIRKLKIMQKIHIGSRASFSLTPSTLVHAHTAFKFINIFIADEDKLSDWAEFLANGEDVKTMLEFPTVECVEYILQRLQLMRTVMEKNIFTVVRLLCQAEKGEAEENSPSKKAIRSILQLAKNELKLSEMLEVTAKGLKHSLEDQDYFYNCREVSSSECQRTRRSPDDEAITSTSQENDISPEIIPDKIQENGKSDDDDREEKSSTSQETEASPEIVPDKMRGNASLNDGEHKEETATSQEIDISPETVPEEIQEDGTSDDGVHEEKCSTCQKTKTSSETAAEEIQENGTSDNDDREGTSASQEAGACGEDKPKKERRMGSESFFKFNVQCTNFVLTSDGCWSASEFFPDVRFRSKESVVSDLPPNPKEVPPLTPVAPIKYLPSDFFPEKGFYQPTEMPDL